MENQIEIQQLRKEFGDIVAVDDVSFSLEEGEFASIVGPSGSGKTTILRCIAGFESPERGTITVNGVDVTDKPPFERNLNMVFQSLALFDHLTVAENIEYGLKYGDESIPERERQMRVEEMLEIVDLPGYGDRNLDELSGGERQRVALARALVKEPDLLLFDEPLSSLDRKLRQHMQVELQRVQAETGITFLYVTHDQEVALSVSDKMLLLNEGQIEQQGTPEELYNDPETAFSADFIGDINTFTASIASVSGDAPEVELNGRRYALPPSAVDDSDRWSGGETIDLCVRPHAVELVVTEPDRTDRIVVEGSLTGRSYTGDGFVYTVSTDEGQVRVSNVDRRIDRDGDVYVAWDPADSFVYAREDGGAESGTAEPELAAEGTGP